MAKSADWCRGKTKETCKKIRIAAEKKSKTLKGRKLSEENKKNIGISNSKALKGRKLSKEHKDSIRNGLKKYYQTKEAEDMLKNRIIQGKTFRFYNHFTKDYDNLRSNWERSFCEWFVDNNIDYRYEYKSFTLSNGTIYIPDFYLINEMCFYEIKGFGRDKNMNKVELFRKDYKHIPLILIDKDVIKSYDEWFKYVGKYDKRITRN